MRRWRRGIAAVLILVLAVFVALPGAQGQFWVLVNGALNYTGSVTVTSGPLTQTGNGLAATPTDGLVLQNLTDATAGVPVQMSPRIRLRSQTWNTTTAATNTNDWTMFGQASTGLTPLGALYFRSSLNGAAYTAPVIFDSDGNVTTLGTVFAANGAAAFGASATLSASGSLLWTGASRIRSPANGQLNLFNTASTSGVGLDVLTDAVLKVRTTAQTGYATVDALAYQVSGVPGVGFALSHANPANQTGNGTATLKMNGLGAAGAPCTITPTSTGRVVFTITGDLTNSVILDGVTYKLVYGTGSAPANAAVASGTVISATRTAAVSTAAQQQGFSVTASVTGLSLVATWFDLQIADVTGGTASVLNIDCTAHEI